MWILIYTHTLIRQSVNKRKEINNIINTFPDTSKKDKGEKKRAQIRKKRYRNWSQVKEG